jgi:hypothetical protein
MAMPDEIDRAMDEARKSLLSLAVRMRRAQVEAEGNYTAAGYARKKALERHFDQHARELLGDAGEVRQPGAVGPPS